MMHLKSFLVRDAASSGWMLIAAFGLLAAAGGFYFSAVRPEQARLEELHRQIVQLRQRSAGSDAAPKAPAEQLAAFYGFFPAPDALPDLLGKVFNAAGRHALTLEQGEYRPLTDGAGGLMRYQVVLPLRGTYPQIRKFVDASLAEVPTLSLESIQFERQKIGDPTVEAKARFVVYLGRKS